MSLARKDADRALAERLFENLRNLILDGVWRDGDKLPGTRIIARDAGVSRWTAVVAIDMLIAEGLAEARKRSGTYVSWHGATRSQEPQRDETLAPKAPFAFGVPALDLFPMHIWRKLQARRWRQMPPEALDDGYTAGWPALRQAIAEFAATVRGINCTPEQVIVVASVESAARLTAQALCRPGSFCWIEDPAAPATYTLAQSAQLMPIPIALDREGIDVAAGRRLAPLASLAVVTPAVQFPTGTRMSDNRRRELLDWAASANGWILEIDHGGEFPFGAPPLAASRGAERVVYFDTFGKLLFPSLRVAYLIVPRAALPHFKEAARNQDRPPPVPSQIILADFLASGQFAKHLRRSRQAYVERRQILLTALQDELGDGVRIESGQAGLFVCLRLQGGVDDTAIVESARERGLIVTALSPHYFRPTDDRGLILGFSGFTPDQLRQGAKELAVVMKASAQPRGRAVAG